jgi:hypothetical protein
MGRRRLAMVDFYLGVRRVYIVGNRSLSYTRSVPGLGKSDHLFSQIAFDLHCPES